MLQHNYKDIEHLQSVAAIPQIIEKSIYISSEENHDKKKNPDVAEYQHYVCGLKIGDINYTVHAIVAVDNKGNRYYDHNLVHIEKGKLLDQINGQAVKNGFGTTPDTKSTTNSAYKFNALVSLLQTNASKIVDENGEPMVVYHGDVIGFNGERINVRQWISKRKNNFIDHEIWAVNIKYKDNPKSSKVVGEARPSSTEEITMREAIAELLRSMGIDVIADEKEGQEVLDLAGDMARLMGTKKSASETVSVSQSEEHLQTVVSSADGTKVLNNLEISMEK